MKLKKAADWIYLLHVNSKMIKLEIKSRESCLRRFQLTHIYAGGPFPSPPHPCPLILFFLKFIFSTEIRHHDNFKFLLDSAWTKLAQ